MRSPKTRDRPARSARRQRRPAGREDHANARRPDRASGSKHAVAPAELARTGGPRSTSSASPSPTNIRSTSPSGCSIRPTRSWSRRVTRLEPDRRHRCLVFVDDGLLGARPGLAGRDRAYCRHHAGAHGAGRARRSRCRAASGSRTSCSSSSRCSARCSSTRIDRHSYVIAIGGGARARRGRAGRGDHAPRRAPDPRADHGARAGRFRRRRQERRQPVRRQELLRHLRAAVRGAERPRPADAARRRATRSPAWPRR